MNVANFVLAGVIMEVVKTKSAYKFVKMRGWTFALGIYVLYAIFYVDAQEKQAKKRKKIKPGRIKTKPGAMLQALTINYPLSMFTVEGADHNWRDGGVIDAKLKRESDKGKPYTEYAQAQDMEDIWLYENWFYGMKNGLIMESGALDGFLFSTSYMFEKFANWTAIHVEADPSNYDDLKINRNDAINVHGALCNEPMLLHYSSLGVKPVRGFVEFMTPSFLKKWHGPIYNNKTRIEDLPTVQCLPAKTLFRELSVKHIDLWILDVEGAEESVLKGVDFSKIHFNAVAMECDEHDNSKNDRKTSILEANGFKCFLVERNCMCKHKSYTPSTAAELSTLQKWNGYNWQGSYVAPAAKAGV